MFLSPLAKQLMASLRNEPHLWERRNRTLRREDGVEIQFLNAYERRPGRPRLTHPREVSFGGLEAILIGRAIRSWLHRPI